MRAGLGEAIRADTLDWLAGCLATASGAMFPVARHVLVNAIPEDCCDVLDGGEVFIFAVDQAAVILGCDPNAVALRPWQLDS